MNSKLVLAFALGVCGVMTVGAIGWYTVHQVRSQYRQVSHETFRNTVDLLHMRSAARDLIRAVYALAPPATWTIDAELIEKEIYDVVSRYDSFRKRYLEVPFRSPKEKELFEIQDRIWQQERKVAGKAVELGRAHDSRKRNEFFRILREELRPIVVEHSSALQDLIELNEVHRESLIQGADAATDRGGRLFYFVTLICAAFLLVVAATLGMRLSRDLRKILGSLESGATGLTKAAREIAASGKEVTDTAERQADSVQKSSSSLQQMSAIVDRNSEQCADSLQDVERSDGDGKLAREAIQKMKSDINGIIASNNEIADTIDLNSRRVESIVELIKQMSEKTKVINEIVFQTKLLSFNASVEAARAGEHGRGFSVVAEEVGNLAKMSGVAAKDIATMVERSVDLVRSIVAETRRDLAQLVKVNKEKVETGLQSSDHCAQAVDSLLGSMSSVATRVREIAQASQEQAAGVRDISRTILQLDEATQTNVSTAATTARASADVHRQSAELGEIVLKLNTIISGTARVGSSALPERSDLDSDSAASRAA